MSFVFANSTSSTASVPTTSTSANVTVTILSTPVTSQSTITSTTVAPTTTVTTMTTPTTTAKPDPTELKIFQCHCKTGFCNITKQDNLLGVMFYSQTNTSYYFNNYMVVSAPQSIQQILTDKLKENQKKQNCENIEVPEQESGIYTLPLENSCVIQTPGNFFYLKPNSTRKVVKSVTTPCPVETKITLQPIEISKQINRICACSPQTEKTAVILNFPTTVSFPQQTIYFIIIGLCVIFLFLIISCRPMKMKLTKRSKDYY